MATSEDIKWLYSKLKSKGYDIGTEGEFKSSLSNVEDRKWYYDKARAMGLDVGKTQSDFDALFDVGYKEGSKTPQTQQPATSAAATPSSSPDPNTTPAPKAAWKPTAAQIAAPGNYGNDAAKRLNDYAKPKQEAVSRNAERLTGHGRNKAKVGKAVAEMLGTPTSVVGFETSGKGKTTSKQAGQTPKSSSTQSPIPYGVKIDEDGNKHTEWLMPDGTTTTSLLDANNAEAAARTARLQHGFERRMAANGLNVKDKDDVELQAYLDRQQIANNRLREAMSRRRQAEKKAEEGRDWLSKIGASFNAGLRGKVPTGHDAGLSDGKIDADIKAATADVMAMREAVRKKTDEIAGRRGASWYEKVGRGIWSAASNPNTWTGGMVDMSINSEANYAKAMGDKASGAQLSALEAKMAKDEATQSAADNLGGWYSNPEMVMSMALDPKMYAGGMVASAASAPVMRGIGALASLAGKQSINIGSRLFSSSLGGMITNGAVTSGLNMATYEGLGNFQDQLTRWSSGDTPQKSKGDVGELVSNVLHGAALGIAMGAGGALLGNVTAKGLEAVKPFGTGAKGAMAKAGVHAASQGVSAVLNGTIFATDEWIKGGEFNLAHGIATDLGFKAQHMVTGVKGTVDAAMSGRKGRKNVWERVNEHLAAMPSAALTSDDKDILKQCGYDISSMFRKPTEKQETEELKRGNIIGDGPELSLTGRKFKQTSERDGYEQFEAAMQDPNVPETVKAKLNYIFNGEFMQPSTIFGCTVHKNEETGIFTVNSVSANGSVITSRKFKSETHARAEQQLIMRQAELNSISIGEQYTKQGAWFVAMDEASDMVSAKYRINKDFVRSTVEKFSRNEELSDVEKQVIGAVLAEAKGNEAKYKGLTPDGMKEVIRNEYGLDVEECIRKGTMRNPDEEFVVQEYLRRLYKEFNRHIDARRVWEREAGDMRNERRDAWRRQMEGRLLKGAANNGDPDAQRKVEEIEAEHEQAWQRLLNAFGQDFGYWEEALMEDPFDVLSNETITDEQRNAILAYLSADAAYCGIVDANKDAKEKDQLRAAHDARTKTHNQSQNIVTATMKSGDRQVFIVDGDIEVLDDGYLNLSECSDMLVIYDETTGKFEQCSPNDILRIESQEDAKEYVFARFEEIEKKYEIDAEDTEQPTDGEPPVAPAEDAPEAPSTTPAGQSNPVPESAPASAGAPAAAPASAPAAPAEAPAAPTEAPAAPTEAPAAPAEAPAAPPTPTEPAKPEQPAQQGPIPVGEDGKPQYDRAKPEDAWDALEAKLGEYVGEFIENKVNSAKKALDKIFKAKPKFDEDPDVYAENIRKHEQAVAEAQRLYSFWMSVGNSAKGRMEEKLRRERQAAAEAQIERERREYQQRKDAEKQKKLEDSAEKLPQYRKAINGMDEPMSAREAILRDFLSGLKLRWGKSKHGSLGVEGSIFGKQAKSFKGEWNKRKWMLDEENGMDIDTYVERFCQAWYKDYEQGTDHSREVQDMVLEMLQQLDSPDSYWRALQEERKNNGAEVGDDWYGQTPEQEAREQAFYDKYGMSEQELDEFEAKNEDKIDLSDEEYKAEQDAINGERADQEQRQKQSEEERDEAMMQDVKERAEDITENPVEEPAKGIDDSKAKVGESMLDMVGTVKSEDEFVATLSGHVGISDDAIRDFYRQVKSGEITTPEQAGEVVSRMMDVEVQNTQYIQESPIEASQEELNRIKEMYKGASDALLTQKLELFKDDLRRMLEDGTDGIEQMNRMRDCIRRIKLEIERRAKARSEGDNGEALEATEGRERSKENPRVEYEADGEPAIAANFVVAYSTVYYDGRPIATRYEQRRSELDGSNDKSSYHMKTPWEDGSVVGGYLVEYGLDDGTELVFFSEKELTDFWDKYSEKYMQDAKRAEELGEEVSPTNDGSTEVPAPLLGESDYDKTIETRGTKGTLRGVEDGVAVYVDENGKVVTLLCASSEETYIGFYTDKRSGQWTCKAENNGASKLTWANIMKHAVDKLPIGAELIEGTSVSLDGLRMFAQQLKHGFESTGKTYQTELNAADRNGVFKEQIRNNDPFNSINWRGDIEELCDILEPYLAALGMNRNAVTRSGGVRVKLRLPVLVKTGHDGVAEPIKIELPKKEQTPRKKRTFNLRREEGGSEIGNASATKVEVADTEAVPTPTSGGRKLVITDEMKADEDILRDILGIDDSDVSDDVVFRAGDVELTPAQKRKVFAAGVNYALGYIDQGFVSFDDFAKAMVGRLGAQIKPWLKSFYEGAKRMPGYEGYEFTPSAEVDSYNVAMTDKPRVTIRERSEIQAAENSVKKISEAEKLQAFKDDFMSKAVAELVCDISFRYAVRRNDAYAANLQAKGIANDVVYGKLINESEQNKDGFAAEYARELLSGNNFVTFTEQLLVLATEKYKEIGVGNDESLIRWYIEHNPKALKTPFAVHNIAKKFGIDSKVVKSVLDAIKAEAHGGAGKGSSNKEEGGRSLSEVMNDFYSDKLINKDAVGDMSNDKAVDLYIIDVLNPNLSDNSPKKARENLREILKEISSKKLDELWEEYRMKPGATDGVTGIEHLNNVVFTMIDDERVARTKNSDKPSAESTKPDLTPIINVLRGGKPNGKPEPVVNKPGTRPEQQLAGNSAEFQEKEKQTAAFVSDMAVAIAERADLMMRDNTAGPLRIVDIRRILAGYDKLSSMSETDVLELVEFAMVGLARKIAAPTIGKSETAQRKAYNHICAIYNAQPRLDARDSERIKKQQYSTPLPMGYAMSVFLHGNGKQIGSVFEPTAGNGALTIGFDPRIVHVNEIDEMRAANLRKIPFAGLTMHDATIPFGMRGIDGVVQNPPFGTIETKVYDDGEFEISSLEGQIAINALETMAEDGRAAIIIGGHSKYRSNGSLQVKDAQFLGYLYTHYNVVDVINIDSKKLYSRNGTGFDVRMILIDGRRTGEFERVYPPVQSEARTEVVKTFDELYNRIQDDLSKLQLRRREADMPAGNSDGVVKPVGGSNVPGAANGKLVPSGNTGHAGVRKLASQPVGATSEQGSDNRGTNRLVDGNSGNGVRTSTTGGSQRGTSGEGGRVRDNGGRSDGRRTDGSDIRHDPVREGLASTQKPKEKPAAKSQEDVATQEKLPYPQQSQNGFSLESVIPSTQYASVKRALENLGDVDDFVMQELGFSSKEELYGKLSAEQIDSVAMAISQMNKGRAFIIGDMTGVGKGRQGAALIRSAVRKGKIPVYFTQKPTLFTDNYRDLSDIGSGELRPFIIASNAKDASITDPDTGKMVHKLPSAKEQKRVFDHILKTGKLPDEYDYVLVTYSQVQNGEYEYIQKSPGTWEVKPIERKNGYTKNDISGQKRREIIEALVKDNILILDESHTASGDSGVGHYMQMLVDRASGVTFMSATFAKRPDNMPLYALKTDISQAKASAEQIIDAVKDGGVTLQEIMSQQLVDSGQMLRRERNFDGVTINWLPTNEQRDAIQRRQFDEVAEIFDLIRRFQDDYVEPVVRVMSAKAAKAGGAAGQRKGTKSMGISNAPFASKLYNVVNQLLFAIKADAVVERVIENIKEGKKPVISFNNTMEGFIEELGSAEFDEMPSFATTLIKALNGVMRVDFKDAKGNVIKSINLTLGDIGDEGAAEHRMITEKILELSNGLSLSPIDHIRMKLEEAGYKVAEVSGRETMLTRLENGKIKAVKRTDTDKKKNIRDFNNGDIDVIMLNKAGSTGVSLHASPKFKDTRQRVMVFAQFQMDINDEIQMRGRIDRSGQLVRGVYEYIVSSIPTELRLQMMFKAKLKSLDANTTSSQKSKFNEMEIVDFLNKYGDQIAYQYMFEHPELCDVLGDPLNTAEKEEIKDGAYIDDAAGKLCRSLAFLPVAEQEKILSEISELYTDKIRLLDEAGENELEISTLDLKAKTLEKGIWIHGKDPDSGNTFADNVYIEKIESNILNKPMKRTEVEESMRRLAMCEDGVSLVQGHESFVKGKISEMQGYMLQNYERKKASKEEQIARKINSEKVKIIDSATVANAIKKAGITEEQIKQAIDDATKAIMEKETPKLKKMKQQANDRFIEMKECLERYKPGQIVVIPEKVAFSSDMPLSYGVILGCKVNKTFTPGSSTVVIATLDGRRKVEIPFSDERFLDIKYCTGRQRMLGDQALKSLSLETWDSSTTKDARETRYMLTGNILQALIEANETKLAGHRLVSFTNQDGELRHGILMYKGFKPNKLQKTDSVNASYDSLMKGERVISATKDVELSVVPSGLRQGMMKIAVPKSKKNGGKYFLDDNLLSCVDGKNFNTDGKLMVAYIPADKIREVLNMLSGQPFNLKVISDAKIENAANANIKTAMDSGDLLLRTITGEDVNYDMLQAMGPNDVVVVTRNMQVLPSMVDLASPMAGIDHETGEYRIMEPNSWDGSYASIQLTEEQVRMYYELCNADQSVIEGQDNYGFDIAPGLRFIKKKEGVGLYYDLKKNDKKKNGSPDWVAYNPYNHGKFNTLNLQFSSAHRRPNLVMVEAIMPKSELMKVMGQFGIAKGQYHAPYAKNSVGIVDWNNGEQLALSRWSKIIRVLPNREVAERIDALWKKNPQKSPLHSKMAYNPKRYTPQVLEYLKEMGWKFDPKVEAELNSKTQAEREESYDGMPYITEEDIAKLNTKYEVPEYSGLMGTDPEEMIRIATINTMQDYAEAVANTLGDTKVSIYKTREEARAAGLSRYEAAQKGAYRISTGEIYVILENHPDIPDVVNTMFHESLGHDGIRILFPTEELLNNALDQLYGKSTPKIKAEIDAEATKYEEAEYKRIMKEGKTDSDAAREQAKQRARRKATEEFGARVAGKYSKDYEKLSAEEKTFWGKFTELLNRALKRLMNGLGISDLKGLTFDEKKWARIYYEAYKMKKNGGKRTIKDVAESVAARERERRERAESETVYRTGDDVLMKDRVAARAIYEQRVASGWYQTREALQDSMLGLKELYSAIDKASGRKRKTWDVAGQENAYLFENRLSSINHNECKTYEKLVLQPMLNEVAKLSGNKKGRAELTKYMMAKHGLERNAYMRNEAIANGMSDKTAKGKDFAGLTGLFGVSKVAMAETLAEQLVLAYESTHNTAALWDKVNAATKATLTKLKESGVMSKDTYDKVSSMYKFYIPLRGWAETTTDEVYGYLSRQDPTIRGNVMKKAYGRTSVADDPIATIALMSEQAISQGNRNLMKQSFFNYVRRNPSDLVSINRLCLKLDDVSGEWVPALPDGPRKITDADDAATVERKWVEHIQHIKKLAQTEPDKYKIGRQARNIPYKIGDGVLREHNVFVKCGDDTYILTVNGNPRAAQALNGMSNPDNGSGMGARIIGASQAILRYLAPMLTTRNPGFVVSNFLRDAAFSNTAAWAKESPKYASEFMRNFAATNPIGMANLIWRYEHGKLDMSKEKHRYFQEFMQNGGETGYTVHRSIEQHKKRIEKMIKEAHKKWSFGKMFRAFCDTWNMINGCAENCARFTAYMTSRKNGRDIARSIWDAKEISVNFNKKGAGATFMDATGQTKIGKFAAGVSAYGRAFQIFWNATMQASNGYFRISKISPAKFAALVATPFMIGLMQGLIGAWFDDNDEKKDANKYYNQPDYVRRNFMLLPVGEQFLSYPLPHEYIAPFALGEMLGSIIAGKNTDGATDIAWDCAGLLSEYIPVKVEGATTEHSFIPTGFKPLVEAQMNESWTGMPIYKESPYNKNLPEWTKAYKSANTQLVNLSEALNRYTGGSDLEKGWVDINPAKVEYQLRGYFGGLFNIVDKSVKTYETVAGDREFEWRSMPVVNRVVKQGDERNEGKAVTNDFFKYLEEYNDTKRLLNGYSKGAIRGIRAHAEQVANLTRKPEFKRYYIMDGYMKDLNAIEQDLKEATSQSEIDALEKERLKIRSEIVSKIKGKVPLEPYDTTGIANEANYYQSFNKQ